MPDIEKTKLEEAEKTPHFLGIRHIQYVLLFFVAFVGYGARTVLNVAIYEMISDDGPVKTYPEWAEYKNLMVSSFFWGYICLQIGAGEIAKTYGPKLYLTVSMTLTSVFSILVPIFGEYFGYEGVIICRVIQGLTQGFLFPSIHNLLGEWVPVNDRASVGTFVYAGNNLGTAISMVITGQISGTVGWPVAFYVYGGLGLAWSVLFFFFGFDSPSKHPYISNEERKYIESGRAVKDEKKVPTPWKAIVTSLPVYAILVAHGGQNWGLSTLMSEMPSYMQNILNYDIATNSTFSALPYFVTWVLSFVVGVTADYLIKSNKTTVNASRKIFNSIGFICPAIALVCLTWVSPEQKSLSVTIFVIAGGMNSAILCGFNLNHVDLSSTHAGTLMGITNTFGIACSILAPLAVDFVSDATGYTENDKNLWNIIFNIAAGIYLVAAAFFVFAGSGEEQPWNSPDFNNADKKDNEWKNNTQQYKK